MKFHSFEEFWPFYLSQHSKKSTRTWHFVGTSFVFVFLLAGIATFQFWLVLLAPVTAYLLAWISHFFIEGNKPATFGHPFWSLGADFKMYGYMLTGRLDDEIKNQKGKESSHDTSAFRG
ncbi:DUF962 domain-containing protein [Metabacillus sp. GX 13764]|uniref:DUF962 domain-containing protein n=1 Tax=Metabacillus kandeliae TaxID=2900151 RepID=UPI001E5AA57D|nr:DUF962 domain-containing protein [Metabacillus kandeliae]MCD7036681.1 DUF962 domain-containing protein [Metabacillus kandeliae]